MHHVTIWIKKRSMIFNFVKEQRGQAAEMFRANSRPVIIIACLGVTRGTAARIKNFVMNKDKLQLSKLLDPESNHLGRPRVLPSHHEAPIVNHMKVLVIFRVFSEH